MRLNQDIHTSEGDFLMFENILLTLFDLYQICEQVGIDTKRIFC